MASFVFVPGGWHGGWCWKKVRGILTGQGHTVFAPSLTGLGERRHLLSPNVNLETHIEDVASLLEWEELEEVVLCGHSYGGAVISGAAERQADRIGAVVYVDALLLENGERVCDVLPKSSFAQVEAAALEFGDGWRAPPAPALRYGVNEADRDWVDRRCTPHPLATFLQPLRLTGGLERVAQKTYIYATGWGDGTSLQKSYERAKALGWRTLEFPCGHDVMVDMPEALAGELMAASGG